MSVLTQLLDLCKVKFLMLEIGQFVHTSRVFGVDEIDLCKILLGDDWKIDVRQHLGRIRVEIRTLALGHDSLVKIARLVIFAELALVVVMALARDHIVRYLVRCFGHIGAELVRKAIWCVLLVTCVICIGPHGTIEVE